MSKFRVRDVGSVRSLPSVDRLWDEGLIANLSTHVPQNSSLIPC